MEDCMFKDVRKHCRTINGWLYVQSCFKALHESRWMDVCSKFLKQCREVDGWLYVQSCFKERQDCRWVVVCSKMF